MSIAVPETYDDVTAGWVDAALREGSVLDAQISSTVVEPLHANKGLIGDLATIHVTYIDGESPTTFVLKLPAANPDGRRIGNMLYAYAREVAFYRHVAPQAVNTRLARCYYSGADEPAGRWAILLESIEADDFDFRAGATTTQANAAVDALADFHHLWCDAEVPFGWMPGFDATGVGGLQPFWLNNLAVFVDRYREVLPGPTADWVLAFAPQHRRSTH